MTQAVRTLRGGADHALVLRGRPVLGRRVRDLRRADGRLAPGTAPSPPAEELAAMHARLREVAETHFGAIYIDDNMRNIPTTITPTAGPRAASGAAISPLAARNKLVWESKVRRLSRTRKASYKRSIREGGHDLAREQLHRLQHALLVQVAEPEAAVEVVDADQRPRCAGSGGSPCRAVPMTRKRSSRSSVSGSFGSGTGIAWPCSTARSGCAG